MALDLFPEPLLEPYELADMLGVAVKTLAGWRSEGTGPPYLKLGSRGSVRYRPDDVERWLQQNRCVPGGGSSSC